MALVREHDSPPFLRGGWGSGDGLLHMGGQQVPFATLLIQNLVGQDRMASEVTPLGEAVSSNLQRIVSMATDELRERLRLRRDGKAVETQ